MRCNGLLQDARTKYAGFVALTLGLPVGERGVVRRWTSCHRRRFQTRSVSLCLRSIRFGVFPTNQRTHGTPLFMFVCAVLVVLSLACLMLVWCLPCV